MKIIGFLFALLFTFNVYSEKMTVIGLGRLGICIALALEKAGYEVLGVDLSSEYIHQLNEKSFQSLEPGVNELLRSAKHFRATSSLKEALEFSQTCFLVLPTNPRKKLGNYDCDLLTGLLHEIKNLHPSNLHLVMNSTLPPGYIRNVAIPLFEPMENVSFTYNPLFIAQGDILNGIFHPDVVLIGQSSKESGDVVEAIYQRVSEDHPYFARMSYNSAEIMKLALNCFITFKISYANLIGDISDQTPDTDKNAILKAIGMDQRVGNKCLSSGFGFGGPCFPRDNRALAEYAHSLNIEPTLFMATDRANQEHSSFMANQLLSLDLPEYLFEDVSYKPNSPVSIIEESQKLVVAKKLAEANKRVVLRDREEVLEEVRQEFGDIFEYMPIE